MTVQAASGERPESGPLQIGDDWPGLFLRGDDAIALGAAIDAVMGWVSICEEVPGELYPAIQRLADVRALIGEVILPENPLS